MSDEVSKDSEKQPPFDAPDMFRVHVVNGGGPQLFLESQRRIASAQRGARFLRELAWWVTPHDRSTGVDEDDQKLGQAFHDGLVLGTALFNDQPGGYTWALGELSTHAPIDDDLKESDHIEYKHQVGVGILEKAGEGLAEAEAYADLLEDWLPEVCPDIRAQSYFEKGFGLMLSVMCEVERTEAERKRLADMEAMATQLEGIHDYDWDQAFKGL